MLEQQGNALTFLAFYTESKVGKTGLTVTVDVYEGTSEIVTAGSATEIGDGLYYYTLASGSVDANANYVAVFKTATTSVDQQHIPALWVVGRTWVNRVDATVSSRAEPGDVMTLNMSATQIAAALDGSTLNIQRGDKIEFTQTIGAITGWTKLYFYLKEAKDTADNDALIWIQVTNPADAVNDGLKRLNGASSTLSYGTLTVADASTGEIDFTLLDTASISLVSQPDLYYGWKWVDADGDTYTKAMGRANINEAIGEAVT